MSLFIVVALAVYSLMHAVVYWGLRPLLLGHRAVAPLAMIFMAAMIVSPIAARLFERSGHGATARALSWVSFTWMGFAFLAFSLFLLLGVAQLLLWTGGKAAPALASFSLYGPQASAVAALMVVSLGIYGMYEAHDLRVEKIVIETAKLPPGKTVVVAQVSDIHLGLMSHSEVLAPIVGKLAELKPDLLVATGDVVDAQINHLEGLDALWRMLEPPLGKLAIYGNHEHYAGIAESREFLTRSGFRLVDDEALEIGPIAVIGVDDNSTLDEQKLLNAATPGFFRLFLKHRPDVNEASTGLFDLQLSGHTHGGQIFPFEYLTRTRFPMYKGMYELAGGSRLYVSRGTGEWGPPMRVGAPPEITLFEIRGK